MTLRSFAFDGLAAEPFFALFALDSLPDLVSYVDTDRRYRFVNHAYHDWYGLDIADIVGRAMHEVLGEESYRLAEPYLDRAFEGEPVTARALMPVKYGPQRQVEARLMPDRAHDGEVCGVFVVVRDIGHGEGMQQETLSVLDGMGACFVALDQDGRIIFMNRATACFVADTGLEQVPDREWFYGQRPWDVKPSAQGGVMHQAFDRVRATGTPEAFEHTSPLIPDRTLDVRVFPTPTGAVGFSFIDVTERRRAEDELRRTRSDNDDLQVQLLSEAAERLKAVRDRERFWTLSQDLLAVISRNDGQILQVNAPAWKATLGYDSEQVVGTRARTFLHPDDVSFALDEMAKLATLPMVELEFRLRHAEGGWRWISTKVISDGELCYSTARDITDDKTREEQVRRTQKLEALGQLTGGVAHDFNNLLTVIMGALDLVQKHPHDWARREQLLSAALVAAKRGEMLNRQLLGFARRQASHLEFVVSSSRLDGTTNSR